MAGKRANGEGSIRQRPDGRWEGRYVAGYLPNGKPDRKSVYGDTQADVKKKLREITQSLEEGEYIAPNKITVESWLNTWFNVYFLPHHRESTATIYDVNIRAYLVPNLGRHMLQKLRVEHIQAFVTAQAKESAPATVRKMVEVLRAALKQAVSNGLIAKNPCDSLILPKMEQREIQMLSPEEQSTFLKALPDSEDGRALSFILFTGLRVSELCALRWEDVEDDHFTVRQGLVRTKAFEAEVEGSRTKLTIAPPKSKAGMRAIPILPEVSAILRQQYRLFAERKLKAGPAWKEGDYVFCSEAGSPKDPANLRRSLKRVLKAANLEQRGLHALRHTFATNLIRAGVDARTVGELIGHSKVAFTLQTYVHSSDEQKRQALEAMRESFF